MKKFLSYILTIIVSASTLISTASANNEFALADAPDMNAAAYMLLDMNTGNVLASENMYERVYPASTTKLLTALVTLEMLDLDEEVEVTSQVINDLPVGSSNAGLLAGEILTVEDLLYCVMVQSANEASMALAYHIGDGDPQVFHSLMNIYATNLGAYDSNFTNSHGFHDDNHYTTAYDMSLIADKAFENEFLAQVMITAQKRIPATNLSEERLLLTSNHNIFRVSDPRYYKYSLGGKTGYTGEAKNCLVSAAEKDDQRLLSLIFGTTPDTETGANLVFEETIKLFEWGFSAYTNVSMLDILVPMETVSVKLSSEADSVSLKPESTVYGLVPSDYDATKIEKISTIPENVNAPITENQIIGTVEVFYDGISYGTSNLLAVNDVEVSMVLYYVDIIEGFFQSSIFYLVVLILVILIAFSALLQYRQKQIRRKRRILKKRRQVRRSQGYYSPSRRR